jgi:hypothetical protein
LRPGGGAPGTTVGRTVDIFSCMAGMDVAQRVAPPEERSENWRLGVGSEEASQHSHSARGGPPVLSSLGAKEPRHAWPRTTRHPIPLRGAGKPQGKAHKEGEAAPGRRRRGRKARSEGEVGQSTHTAVEVVQRLNHAKRKHPEKKA